MNMKKILKKVLVFSVLAMFCAGSFAQTRIPVQELSTSNASWSIVISGKAVCEPQITSYGFAVLTDGKMISACSNNGTALWEKKIPGRPEPFFTVFSSDFLLTVSDKKNLSLINPSGLTLWTKELPFEITDAPVAGRDSRIFVKGKNRIACLGVNGVCKWMIETPSALRDLPLYEMNDGSVIAFLEQEVNGKSSGIRITPFGEQIETINFAGLVKNAKTLPGGGILLVFTGNGAGLCSVINKQTVTKWAIPSEDKAFGTSSANSGAQFLILNKQKSALAISSGSVTRLMVFNNSDGRVSDYFDVNINYSKLTCASITKDGQSIFLSDNKMAMVYSSNGTVSWNGRLPTSGSASNWNYLTYTNSNHLILCGTQWLVNGYRTSYRLVKKSTATPGSSKKLDYSNYYNVDTTFLDSYNFTGKIDSKYLGENRINKLSKGFYGEQEQSIGSGLHSLSQAYLSYLRQKNSGARPEFRSVFETDTKGVLEFINQICLMGTDDYPKIMAQIIRNEPNEDNLKCVLSGFNICGYDPDNLVLYSIEARMQEISGKNASILNPLIDSVYEICRFMGRPALYDKGMDILTKLLYPQYDSIIRDHARETLVKIANLKI